MRRTRITVTTMIATTVQPREQTMMRLMGFAVWRLALSMFPVRRFVMRGCWVTLLFAA